MTAKIVLGATPLGFQVRRRTAAAATSGQEVREGHAGGGQPAPRTDGVALSALARGTAPPAEPLTLSARVSQPGAETRPAAGPVPGLDMGTRVDDPSGGQVFVGPGGALVMETGVDAALAIRLQERTRADIEQDAEARKRIKADTERKIGEIAAAVGAPEGNGDIKS